jgi:hypothetical protein
LVLLAENIDEEACSRHGLAGARVADLPCQECLNVLDDEDPWLELLCRARDDFDQQVSVIAAPGVGILF